MKVWLSAELSKEVLTEEQILQECKARNAVVDTLNLRLNDKFYNIPLNSWDWLCCIKPAWKAYSAI